MIPDVLIQKMLASYAAQPWIKDWAAHLPGDLNRLVRKWQLKPDYQNTMSGYWSLVIPCWSPEYGKVALKICPDATKLSREAAALKVLCSPPSVALLAQNTNALLLEWLQDAQPIEKLSLAQQAELLDLLHNKTAKILANEIGHWQERTINYRIQRIKLLEKKSGMTGATKLIKQLSSQLMQQASGQLEVVCHGDLYYQNILASQGQTRAIDPFGVSSPREFDIANIAINYSDPGDDIKTNIIKLAVLLDANQELALTAGRSYALIEAVHHQALKTEQAYRSKALLEFACSAD